MDEVRRVAALRGYGLLDTPVGDDELEGALRLAAAVAGVPNATLNLIDEDRQCQLTTVGFEGSTSARTDSMCAVRLLDGKTVWTPDARTHPDYAANPWVTGRLGSVRFYASVPLLTADGHVLGTLCVFDHVAGDLTQVQVDLLEDAAGVVMALFERRRQARQNATLAAEADEQRTLIEMTMGALEERYETTEAILETIDVGVAVADAGGRLTLLNRAAREWHGLEGDPHVYPAQFSDRYDVRAADGVTRLTAQETPLLRALTEGRVSGEEVVIALDGRPPVRVTASGRALVAADGTLLGAVIAMSDVTRDRAQRTALQSAHAELADRTRELERSNGELEQFAATVSHDLRSPLTVVDGYLELLDEVYEEALGEQGRTWIATARRGLGRTLKLTNALLDYAQAGAATCVWEWVDLREVVDAAVIDLRHEIVGADARIEPGDLPTLRGDESLLRQLVQNLLGNAIKHRLPGRACRVQVTAAVSDGEWVISVADNGRGVPVGDRQRVFAMFTTADQGARTGHGIGLATCQRIVERHGGRIWITDTPGGGATVHVALRQDGEHGS